MSAPKTGAARLRRSLATALVVAGASTGEAPQGAGRFSAGFPRAGAVVAAPQSELELKRTMEREDEMASRSRFGTSVRVGLPPLELGRRLP